jgi:hypothetical protein
MNPNYMGGGGQPGENRALSIENAFQLQEELILNWNYFIYIPSVTSAHNPAAFTDKNSMLYSYVKLANKYPEIPLGVTTFWMHLQPHKLGYTYKKPNVLRTDLPDRFYIKDIAGNVIKRRLNFAAPDSLFIQDGKMQAKCIQNLLNNLSRSIDLINENGEEPPGVFPESQVSGDKDMIVEKEKLGIESWKIYMSLKKAHFRKLYSSQFMSIPELKNTLYTTYIIEGGPIDRFHWNSTKDCVSKIKGNYYSTPDFYPRYPDNWRTWKGAWHGWKWINDGRRVEIKSGDRFFSPFIAAGWANDPEKDIRPGQWLGLLKCLSVVGAEFYYVAYFNLKAPFSKPENYVWQAAIPAYAQAVTTRYEDLFRNGNVLKDDSGNPIVTYPVRNNSDKDLLVTVRKHDAKEQYIIAATVQHDSNHERSPITKDAEIVIGNTSYVVEARRQGSVYFLDKTKEPYVFYQLDKWHQYMHPSHWRKEIILEAELADSSSEALSPVTIYQKAGSQINLSNSETYVPLKKDGSLSFGLENRDIEKLSDIYIKLLIRSESASAGKISINGNAQEFKVNASEKWNWITIQIDPSTKTGKQIILTISSVTGSFEIDKLCIAEGANPPDLTGY